MHGREGNPFLVGQEWTRLRTPGRVAWKVARPLAEMLARARNEGAPVDPEVVEWVRAVQVAAAEYRQARDRTAACSDDGRSEYRPELPAARLPHELDAKQVAQRLGITPRAVGGLAVRGTLPGRKVAGRWVFELDDVVDYLEARDGAAA